MNETFAVSPITGERYGGVWPGVEHLVEHSGFRVVFARRPPGEIAMCWCPPAGSAGQVSSKVLGELLHVLNTGGGVLVLAEDEVTLGRALAVLYHLAETPAGNA